MYLRGRKFFWSFEGKRPKVDGIEVAEVILDLGYWRKHPNLHGYIVQTFAGGEDECQEIDLQADQLQQIIGAIKNKELPETEGFFFGKSDGSEDEESIATLEKAKKWLDTKDKAASRSVFYRASW